MTGLRIVAVLEVKPECQNELEVVFKQLVEASRNEDGCLVYDLHQSVDNSLRYTIFESWKSQDAIDEHNETSHFKSFVAAIEGKVSSLSIDVLKQVY